MITETPAASPSMKPLPNLSEITPAVSDEEVYDQFPELKKAGRMIEGAKERVRQVEKLDDDFENGVKALAWMHTLLERLPYNADWRGEPLAALSDEAKSLFGNGIKVSKLSEHDTAKQIRFNNPEDPNGGAFVISRNRRRLLENSDVKIMYDWYPGTKHQYIEGTASIYVDRYDQPTVPYVKAKVIGHERIYAHDLRGKLTNGKESERRYVEFASSARNAIELLFGQMGEVGDEIGRSVDMGALAADSLEEKKKPNWREKRRARKLAEATKYAK